MYLRDHDDKILLNPKLDDKHVIVYREFGEVNILALCLTPTNIIRFSLGFKYEAEIEISIEEMCVDGKVKYSVWLNGENIKV